MSDCETNSGSELDAVENKAFTQQRFSPVPRVDACREKTLKPMPIKTSSEMSVCGKAEAGIDVAGTKTTDCATTFQQKGTAFKVQRFEPVSPVVTSALERFTFSSLPPQISKPAVQASLTPDLLSPRLIDGLGFASSSVGGGTLGPLGLLSKSFASYHSSASTFSHSPATVNLLRSGIDGSKSTILLPSGMTGLSTGLTGLPTSLQLSTLGIVNQASLSSQPTAKFLPTTVALLSPGPSSATMSSSARPELSTPGLAGLAPLRSPFFVLKPSSNAGIHPLQLFPAPVQIMPQVVSNQLAASDQSDLPRTLTSSSSSSTPHYLPRLPTSSTMQPVSTNQSSQQQPLALSAVRSTPSLMSLPQSSVGMGLSQQHSLLQSFVNNQLYMFSPAAISGLTAAAVSQQSQQLIGIMSQVPSSTPSISLAPPPRKR